MLLLKVLGHSSQVGMGLGAGSLLGSVLWMTTAATETEEKMMWTVLSKSCHR
jgi:hypothetical protein